MVLSKLDRRRTQRGAVAILVAVLAAVLLVVAALSVDLGNAWARKRQVQTQVDIAALSAGHLLPRTDTNEDDILQEVADFLNTANNRVSGQEGSVTVAQLKTPALEDGHVTFSSDGEEMRVVAPTAWVDFKLVGALSSGTDVTADATVRVFSEKPRKADLLPFLLPTDCIYGQVHLWSSGNNVFRPAPVLAVPAVIPAAAGDFNAGLGPSSANEGTTVNITVTVTGISGNLGNETPSVSFTQGSKSYTRAGTWTKATGATKTFTVVIGASDVTSTMGVWNATAAIGTKRADPVAFTVTSIPSAPTSPSETPSTPASGCPSGNVTGNFGALVSPRDVETRTQRENALNIALGLDHELAVRESGLGCEASDPDLLLDNESRDGNNCITGDQSGNGGDPGSITAGLLTGTGDTREGEYDGRLNVSRGATRAGCNGGDSTLGGVTINNDLLSCFLRPGFDLTDLTSPAPGNEQMLDTSVVDSPRFIWLPVVDNRANGWKPVLRFVPAFITDETDTNGLACNNHNCTQVKGLTVFTFDVSALPVSERSPVTDYDETIGRKIVRLID